MNTIETVQALKLKFMQLGIGTCQCESKSFEPQYHLDGCPFRVAAEGSEQAAALLAQMQARNGLADEARSDEKDSAPVVQVVEPLTDQEIIELRKNQSGRYGFAGLQPYGDTLQLSAAVQTACARKWGLSLKENT